MLSLPASIRVFLAREPVDFRKAHDGLCAIVRQQFLEDPFAGDVFVFFNRARDRIKLLLWDRNGFWLFYRRWCMIRPRAEVRYPSGLANHS